MINYILIKNYIPEYNVYNTGNLLRVLVINNYTAI